MAKDTGIAWCDSTFNPWRGCTKVGPGCKFCYASSRSKRFGEDFAGTRIRLSDSGWREPLKWNKVAERDGVRRRVFCASLADVFEEWDGPIVDQNGHELHRCEKGCVTAAGCLCHTCNERRSIRPLTLNDLRSDLFRLIDETPHLDWLLLTKRPENVRRMWPDAKVTFDGGIPSDGASQHDHYLYGSPKKPVYRRNVWIGTSVENQEQADKRIPELLKCHDLSPCLFLSCEPLLGNVDMTTLRCGSEFDKTGQRWFNALAGYSFDDGDHSYGYPHIDWVIIGVESNGKRVGRLGEFASESAWWDGAAAIVEQCQAAGVPCFVKQGPRNGRVTHDLSEFPETCRVREFPTMEESNV